MSALACLAVCVLAWGAPAARFDFKGVVIGEPATPQDIEDKFKDEDPFALPKGLNADPSFQQGRAALKQHFAVKCGVGAGAGGLYVCNGAVTVAGAYSDMNILIGTDGIVQRIRLPFEARSFSDVEAAVLQKFGKPTKSTHEVVQNRMGGSFDNVTHYWIGANKTEVMLTQYAGSLDESLLLFSTEAERKMREDLQKKNARDL